MLEDSNALDLWKEVCSETTQDGSVIREQGFMGAVLQQMVCCALYAVGFIEVFMAGIGVDCGDCSLAV